MNTKDQGAAALAWMKAQAKELNPDVNDDWNVFYLARVISRYIQPPPTPETGEKELTMIELPKPTGDFILAQKDIPYKQASDGAYWHYKDVITLLHRYAAQQPHSPALQGDDEVVNILGLDNPFPLRLVLQLLTKATKKLLHEKDYDGPDYEEMERCVTRANEIILFIDKYQSHPPAQPLTTDEEAAPVSVAEALALIIGKSDIAFWSDNPEAKHNALYQILKLSKVAYSLLQSPIVQDDNEALRRYPGKTKKAGPHGGRIKEKRSAFLAGCQHVRSQQQIQSDYDLARLYDWVTAENIKPSITAFTSGPLRNVAREIEYRIKSQPVDAVDLQKRISEYLMGLKLIKSGNSIFTSDACKSLAADLLALFPGSQASNQSEGELWKEVAGIIYEHDGKLVATIDRLKERFHITPKTQQHD